MTRRKLIRVLLPLLVALLLAVVAAKATAKPVTKTVPILVTSTTVQAGEVFSSANVTTEMVRPSSVMLGTLSDPSSVYGKVSLVSMAQGAPILANETEAPSTAGLSYSIPSGQRAMTLAVNGVSGVAGSLTAGDHVDVLLTLGAQSASSGLPVTPPLSTVIVQNIRVLSTGLYGQGGPSSGYALVTLSVTPAQAATIALGEQQGSITLLLRAHGDGGQATTEVRLGGIVP